MKFSRLVEHVSKKPIPPYVKHLIVEVMVSDEEGEDVEVYFLSFPVLVRTLSKPITGSIHCCPNLVHKMLRKKDYVVIAQYIYAHHCRCARRIEPCLLNPRPDTVQINEQNCITGLSYRESRQHIRRKWMRDKRVPWTREGW